jgi:dUTP pyrophosphatase
MQLLLKARDESIVELYAEQKNHASDSGFDLFFPYELTVHPFETVCIDFGISAQLVDMFSHVGQRVEVNRPFWLMPRSSISKTPLRMSNSMGLIDKDYRGSLKVFIDNIKNEPYTILKGQRLFQLVTPTLEPIFRHSFVTELQETARGEGGFGSTGI